MDEGTSPSVHSVARFGFPRLDSKVAGDILFVSLVFYCELVDPVGLATAEFLHVGVPKLVILGQGSVIMYKLILTFSRCPVKSLGRLEGDIMVRPMSRDINLPRKAHFSTFDGRHRNSAL
jgi:hypothetical protein